MGILGIEHVQLAMPAGASPRAEARGSSAALKIHLGVEADFRPARKAHPALRVEGLERLVESLRAGGHPVVDDEPLEGYERVYVSDPFGNRIELMEPTR